MDHLTMPAGWWVLIGVLVGAALTWAGVLTGFFLGY